MLLTPMACSYPSAGYKLEVRSKVSYSSFHCYCPARFTSSCKRSIGISSFTSTMRFSLIPNLEKCICFYCGKVFYGSQAVGGHIPGHFRDGMPPLFENALPCPQNCFGNCSSLLDSVSDVDSGLGSNQLRSFVTLDFIPCNPSQSLGQGGVGQSKKNNGGKRCCSAEAQGNAGTVNELKRTKINSDEMEIDSSQKRELLLFKEEDVSSYGRRMLFNVEEGDLDLSLHL